jgi:hypothetical protein
MSGGAASHAVSTGRAVFITSNGCPIHRTLLGRQMSVAPKVFAHPPAWLGLNWSTAHPAYPQVKLEAAIGR